LAPSLSIVLCVVLTSVTALNVMAPAEHVKLQLLQVSWDDDTTRGQYCQHFLL